MSWKYALQEMMGVVRFWFDFMFCVLRSWSLICESSVLSNFLHILPLLSNFVIEIFNMPKRFPVLGEGNLEAQPKSKQIDCEMLWNWACQMKDMFQNTLNLKSRNDIYNASCLVEMDTGLKGFECQLYSWRGEKINISGGKYRFDMNLTGNMKSDIFCC